MDNTKTIDVLHHLLEDIGNPKEYSDPSQAVWKLEALKRSITSMLASLQKEHDANKNQKFENIGGNVFKLKN